ncbi:hypothetical protein FSP39_009880 [Pinctada imbricata]|uniref:MPN domain-containing protein n=1 Tax=Pinctada imbricata TaxID=66713 RepID=A0AA89BKI0_PINIB|nr:hypothetical protein FSP39_009880 [Pinctada imbricata]
MADIEVSIQAYCKLLLHAAKYPHCAVNGILLAKDNRSSDNKTIKFVDCIPLFHLTLGLSPMLEAALLQIDTYCRSIGCVIAGYYQANELLQDKEMNNIAKIIGKRIQENNNSNACVFMIDNERVSPNSTMEVYRVHIPKDTAWNVDKRQTVEEETLRVASVLLSSDACKQLVDFDCHLDDVSKDWRNIDLNDMIAKCT